MKDLVQKHKRKNVGNDITITIVSMLVLSYYLILIKQLIDSEVNEDGSISFYH